MFPRPFVSFLLVVVAFLSMGCSHEEKPIIEPRSGPWRMELDLNGVVLPFLFEFAKGDSGAWSMLVQNGPEEIAVNDIVMHHDTILVRMPLFDSEFKGVRIGDSLITGHWYNYLKGPEYRIPFTARAGVQPRFHRAGGTTADVGGTWEVHFDIGSPDAYNAIGIFEQRGGGLLTGTFVTETGDYRYLEGVAQNDSMALSCFDGSHAFLFRAALRGDSLHGRFWSGTHWQEPWIAVRNPDYRLRNADSLTYLREGYDMIEFRFPDLDGKMISPSDDRFKERPLMIQVMGSWCPNCVDEARLLNDMYALYHERGLEMIAVAFEKHDDPEKAVAGLQRFRDVLGVQYPIVYAGLASKEVANEKLPFLDHVMSYPTCIFVDRKGTVRRIRTGFYGPSTGLHYETYKRNLGAFIEQLLAEKSLAQADR